MKVLQKGRPNFISTFRTESGHHSKTIHDEYNNYSRVGFLRYGYSEKERRNHQSSRTISRGEILSFYQEETIKKNFQVKDWITIFFLFFYLQKYVLLSTFVDNCSCHFLTLLTKTSYFSPFNTPLFAHSIQLVLHIISGFFIFLLLKFLIVFITSEFILQSVL